MISRGPDPAARLRDVRVPGEDEAEQRSWEVVRTAYEERTPARPARRARPLVLALGGGLTALAIVLSPAGAKVGELVSDVVGIGEEDAKPALRSLPAAGELLVESEQGPWIVREDGSKRLLGDYDEASWSPRGMFVAVTDDRELIAVDPAGGVRWTIDAPAAVHDPRWGGIGFDTRIAYRSGDDLWVVDGDGSDERLLARDVTPVPPAWRPAPAEGKVVAGGRPVHLLTYASADGGRTVDVDTGEQVPTTRQDFELLTMPTSGQRAGPAISPDGSSLATIHHVRGGDELALIPDGGSGRVLYSTRGELVGPTWSPDGHWLLVGLPEADQWLFIPTKPSDKLVPIDSISEQFAPGATSAASFPHVSGWILPQR